LKLKVLLAGGTPSPDTAWKWAFYLFGLSIILISSVLLFIDIKNFYHSEAWLYIVFICGIGTVLLTSILIGDAFIRMKRIDDPELFLPNDAIFKHVSTFFFYAISLTVLFSLQLGKSITVQTYVWINLLYIVCDFCSCLALLYIFQILLTK
jgi:hypothetical protein